MLKQYKNILLRANVAEIDYEFIVKGQNQRHQSSLGCLNNSLNITFVHTFENEAADEKT